MKDKGKAYANKKPKDKRPKNDNYPTPISLVWKLKEKENFSNVLEPAAGEGAIVTGLNGVEKYSDITTGHDFFDYYKWHGDIVTNPPFFIWDEFVIHAKKITNVEAKICMLGRMNYFGTYSRSKSGIWDNLKKVYVFNRMVDYQTPYREDGFFHVGAMVTAWFLWCKWYTGNPEIEILDVQEYAKLGQFRRDK